jgi:hypothetical protein
VQLAVLESKVEGLRANFETGAERLDAEFDDAHPDPVRIPT